MRNKLRIPQPSHQLLKYFRRSVQPKFLFHTGIAKSETRYARRDDMKSLLWAVAVPW
jgi:hypothetical protein